MEKNSVNLKKELLYSDVNMEIDFLKCFFEKLDIRSTKLSSF